jgi:DNA-binding CsgD family transcriptional regulator
MVGDRSNRETAAMLFVTEKTVAAHIGDARRNLGVDTRAEPAAWAVSVGLANAPEKSA